MQKQYFKQEAEDVFGRGFNYAYSLAKAFGPVLCIDFISTLSKLTLFPGLKRLTLLHPDKLSVRLLTSSPSEAVQVKTVGIRPAARNGDRLSQTRLSWGEGGVWMESRNLY